MSGQLEDVHLDAVCAAVAQVDAARRRRGLAIVRARRAGVPVTKIAAVLGVGRATVYRWGSVLGGDN